MSILIACSMRLVRGLTNLPEAAVPCALTIGNFDGVHRGHLEILRLLVDAAGQRGLSTSLMVFEPQPMEYFLQDKAPSRLYRFSEKLRVLETLKLDSVVAMEFGHHLAQMKAEDFIAHILVKRMNVKYLLIGDDFRFGHDRAGDFEMLKSASRQHGFELHSIDSVLESERRISSTAIRELLHQGEIKAASALLGRPYAMCGRVIHGKKLGRHIGWPTINIPVRRRNSPVAGIYAVHVSGIEDDRVLDGVASVGTRPTVDGEGWLLEVHLFDWSGSCYGRRVDVEFVRHLRNEQKFENIDVMTLQIERDAAQARKVLSA
ncbi:MAG: bifunctional riboflavin kinase/FAD synthetase [Gammaproteobacteria bacterium]|nr:bifunctional riboflavin kinase/FAD synthetase [Gammaproteobacteria bacterium]